MRTIEVLIHKDGSTKIQTTGYTGQQCQEATKALESALGTKGVESLTTDYYAQENTLITNTNAGTP